MSSIPPNVVGPILQAGTTQKQASRALENEREQQSNAVLAGSKMREQAAETVGEADNDARVHTDAEGAGSQGRHSGEEQADDKPDEDQAPGHGIHRDDEGQLHVDLEA